MQEHRIVYRWNTKALNSITGPCFWINTSMSNWAPNVFMSGWHIFRYVWMGNILRNRDNHCDLMIAILTRFCTSCRPKITHLQMRHSQRDMFAAIWKVKEVMLKGALLLRQLPPSLFSSFLVLLLLLMMPNHLVADIGCFQCSSINGSNLA